MTPDATAYNTCRKNLFNYSSDTCRLAFRKNKKNTPIATIGVAKGTMINGT